MDGSEKVYHLAPEWSDTPLMDARPIVAQIRFRELHAGGDLELVLALANDQGKKSVFGFPLHDGPAIWESHEKIARWGVRRLGPGVHMIEPSIIVPGLHAFLTLIGVPEPVPWRKT